MVSRRSIVGAIVAGLIATAIGIALSYAIHWFPAQASTQAHNTDAFYHVLVIASVPIFVLVVTVILYSVWKFRMKPGQELQDGPPIHGNTRLEVLWTAIPAVLLLGLVSYSFVVLHENEKKPAGPEMVVNVTGQQFAWSYEYPRSVTGGAPLKSDPAVRAQQRVGPVRDQIARCDPRLLDPRLPPADRRSAGDHDQLPRDTRTGSAPTRSCATCLWGVGHGLMRSTIHVVGPDRLPNLAQSQSSWRRVEQPSDSVERVLNVR